MPVVAIELQRRTVYEGGRSFGATGAYERLDGVARFAVDPLATENRGITDLELAPRDGDGAVRFDADFVIVRPADPDRGAGRLLFQVPNRGRITSLPFSALSAPPSTEISEHVEPGDGFLLRRGWTVAWCGWQWDVIRQPGLLGLAAPEARLPEDAAGQVLVEFQPHVHETHHALGHWPLDPPPGMAPQAHRPYRPRQLDDPAAVMTVRDWQHGAPSEVPRDEWRFARTAGGAVVPDDGFVWRRDGFAPGRIYQVRYRPRDCPVVGAGLLAVRDFVSWLRYGVDAVAGRVDHAIAFGVSQSGRFLREFLYAALNRDGSGRPVFDGVFPHVAGARRGEFNQRYGQPSAQHVPGLGHLPPFADSASPGCGDGLLDRQRERGAMPRVFTVNTSSEYWRSDASLLHTAGGVDLEPPAEVRIYLFAGCQHVPGVLPPSRTSAAWPWVRPANPLNTVDHMPLLRAALVNLDRWVSEGLEPPASAVPRLADGTASERSAVLERFRSASSAVLPDPDRLPVLRRLDLGDGVGEGVVRIPSLAGEPYPCLVSSVGADLNEEAGIRLPDLTVPLASHTGWNPRHRDSGAGDQLLDMMGSSIPLPAPLAAGRSRTSTEHCRLVRAAAERLVEARHLLAEDVDLVVRRAAAAYDAFTRPDRGHAAIPAE